MLATNAKAISYSSSQADAKAGLWRALWEERGRVSTGHPAVCQWSREVREAFTGGERGLPALNPTAAWKLSLKSTKRCNAPGPDNIYGH